MEACLTETVQRERAGRNYLACLDGLSSTKNWTLPCSDSPEREHREIPGWKFKEFADIWPKEHTTEQRGFFLFPQLSGHGENKFVLFGNIAVKITNRSFQLISTEFVSL